MLELFLPYLLAAVVSICSLFAPTINARINHKLTEKEKKEKIKQQKIEHLREVFEGYLVATGEYIANPNLDTKQKYYRSYTPALFYAPNKAKMEMKVLNHHLYEGNFEKITDFLNLVIDDLQRFLEQLSLED